jgi:hypothetical protein
MALDGGRVLLLGRAGGPAAAGWVGTKRLALPVLRSRAIVSARLIVTCGSGMPTWCRLCATAAASAASSRLTSAATAMSASQVVWRTWYWRTCEARSNGLASGWVHAGDAVAEDVVGRPSTLAHYQINGTLQTAGGTRASRASGAASGSTDTAPRQRPCCRGAGRHMRACCRPQPAGPVARVTVAVCDCPVGSVQLMLTLLPGR